MMRLEVADLVAIVCRRLQLTVEEALRIVDVEGAERALHLVSDMRAGHDLHPTPHAKAAALLHALVTRPIVGRDNDAIAVLAVLQFLNLNGLDLDLEPASESMERLRDVARGDVDLLELALWMSGRLRFQGAQTREIAGRVQAAPRMAVADVVRGAVEHIGLDTFARRFEALVSGVGTILAGRDEAIRLSLIALFADGHILLDGPLGSGRTMLARALASAVDADWARYSFGEDTEPADLLGSRTTDDESGFRPGAAVGPNFFLADGIDRARPHVQRALIELIRERSVHANGVIYPLPNPFFVLATRLFGDPAAKFELGPEQLDMFLFRLELGEVTKEDEVRVLSAPEPPAWPRIMTTGDVRTMAQVAKDVSVPEHLYHYIVELVQATRPEHGAPSVLGGSSARGGLALMRTARVVAASQGRSSVIVDDIWRVAIPVLAHRLVLSPDATLTADQIVGQALEKIRPPAA